MRISDWSSDVCSSDLLARAIPRKALGVDDRDRNLRTIARGDGQPLALIFSRVITRGHLADLQLFQAAVGGGIVIDGVRRHHRRIADARGGGREPGVAAKSGRVAGLRKGDATFSARIGAQLYQVEAVNPSCNA